jgi:hypothetical protein
LFLVGGHQAVVSLLDVQEPLGRRVVAVQVGPLKKQTLKPSFSLDKLQGLKPGAFNKAKGQLDSTCTQPHRVALRALGVFVRVPAHRQLAVGFLALLLGVAVQVAFVKSKGLKPGDHLIGSRVETKPSALSKLRVKLYSPSYFIPALVAPRATSRQS